MEMLIYTIKGMNCGHCVKSVQSALEKIPGVDAVAVTLDPPEASIYARSGRRGAGYRVRSKSWLLLHTQRGGEFVGGSPRNRRLILVRFNL